MSGHQISLAVSRKAWMWPWLLQGLKTTPGKLAISVNLEAIRFDSSTERSASDGGNLCPLWSVILKSRVHMNVTFSSPRFTISIVPDFLCPTS